MESLLVDRGRINLKSYCIYIGPRTLRRQQPRKDINITVQNLVVIFYLFSRFLSEHILVDFPSLHNILP